MDVLKKLELAERRLRLERRRAGTGRTSTPATASPASSPPPTPTPATSPTESRTRSSTAKMHGPKQPKAGRPRGLTMRQEAEIAAAVAAGRTMRDIGSQYNVDPKTVSNVAKRNGVTPVRMRTAPR